MSKNNLLKTAFFDAVDKDPKIWVDVEHDGNFTICVLQSHDDSTIGVAKCNPECDAFDEDRGWTIATFRAVKKMMEQSPKNPLSKKLLKAVG